VTTADSLSATSAGTRAGILQVRNLRCSIAGQQVVEDVTFDVPATGITAILGRNGVGKTSTLRGILGLIQRRGEVWLDGDRIDGLPTHRIVQRGVGYVPEDREIFWSEARAVGVRMGIPLSVSPADWPAFEAYWSAMLAPGGPIEVTPTALALAPLILRPALPLVPAPPERWATLPPGLAAS